MSHVVMLDLGDTLVDRDLHPFAGVESALDTLAEFPDFERCIVSDFDGSFDEYLDLLDRTGLRRHFEPVARRVTISSVVGASKPQPAIFRKALERLGVSPPPADVMFITENASHIAATRATGMRALQFGNDFTEWARAPLLIARTFGDGRALTIALRGAVATFDLQLDQVDDQDSGGGRIHGRGRTLIPVRGKDLGSLDGVHVEVPVDVMITVDDAGQVQAVHHDTPEMDEIHAGVRQIAATGELTHTVEVDGKGRRLLRRKRFTHY